MIQQIAERQGWKVKHFHGEWSDHFGGEYLTVNGWWAVCFRDEIEERHITLRSAMFEEGAWRLFLHYKNMINVPEWTTNLEDALSLAKSTNPEQVYANVKIEYTHEFNIPSRWYITWEWGGREKHYQVNTLEEVILALCDAYLAIGPKDE